MKKLHILILVIVFYLSACSLIKTSTDEDNLIATITLGNSIKVTDNRVLVKDNIIKINRGGTYHFNGQLENGYIDVNTKDIVKIILDGVTITNKAGPALLVSDAKKLILEIKNTNYLTDGPSGNKNDAVIYSNDTIIIEGDGILNICGNNQEGISSDDDIIINSGTIRINAIDDGLNAHDDITINGGYLFINTIGDGIDSNGTININGGVIITIANPKNKNGGLDATSKYTITGGLVVASGSRIVAPSDYSTQPSLYLGFDKKQSPDTIIRIDKAGVPLLTFAPHQDFKAFYFSSSDLVEGEKYDINIGGSSTGSQVDGLYTEGTYTRGPINLSVVATKLPVGMDIPKR